MQEAASLGLRAEPQKHTGPKMEEAHPHAADDEERGSYIDEAGRSTVSDKE